MSARTKARKRALDVLYSAELRDQPLGEALGVAQVAALTEPTRAASWEYAAQMIRGVVDHADEIDETIETYARGWTLSRMPAIDRAVLRLGVWEILHNSEVPAAVAVSEAVRLVGELSTEDSAGFVNGVLGRVAEQRG